MKRISKIIGVFIEMLSGCLCLISVATPVAITIASVWGVIEKTSNQGLWRMIFLIIYLGMIIISIFFIGEYAFVSRVYKPTLLQIFSENALSRLLKSKKILDNHGLTLLSLIAGFNMVFAIVIWNGDGHGLQGTWLFTAGGAPIGISLSAMVPINIQRKIWKVVAEKVGKSIDGPYD